MTTTQWTGLNSGKIPQPNDGFEFHYGHLISVISGAFSPSVYLVSLQSLLSVVDIVDTDCQLKIIIIKTSN